MRYTIRAFAGHNHPAKVPFGIKLKEHVTIGENGRQEWAKAYRRQIEAGVISRVAFYDRNNTMVEEITP